MNKYVLSIVIFSMCLISLMQASDYKTKFEISIKPSSVKDQTIERHESPPSYEEYLQSNHNDLIRQRLLILREWAAQFKTGRDVLQDFKRDENSFSWHNLPIIMDPVRVQDCDNVRVEVSDQQPRMKALLAERDMMMQELQALDHWEHCFNLGRFAASRMLPNRK